MKAWKEIIPFPGKLHGCGGDVYRPGCYGRALVGYGITTGLSPCDMPEPVFTVEVANADEYRAPIPLLPKKSARVCIPTLIGSFPAYAYTAVLDAPCPLAGGNGNAISVSAATGRSREGEDPPCSYGWLTTLQGDSMVFLLYELSGIVAEANLAFACLLPNLQKAREVPAEGEGNPA